MQYKKIIVAKPEKRCFQIFNHLDWPSSPLDDQTRHQESWFKMKILSGFKTAHQCAAKQIRRTGGEMPKSNVSPWPPVGWAPIPTLREIACKRFRSQRTFLASAIARDLSFPSRGCQSENLFEKKIGNLFIRLCVQAEDALRQNMQHLNNLIPNQNSSWTWLN